MPFKTEAERKEYAASYYQRNKAKHQERQRLRKERLKAFVRRYKQLKEVKCCDCGEDRWQCLDFDHRDQSEKVESVSYMIQQRRKLSRIKNEIRKCDTVCANCHRLRHNGNVWDRDSNL